MNSFQLSLLIKFILAGALVTLATWYAVQGRTVIAALVGAFPVITLLTLLFTYGETGNLHRIEMLSRHFGLMVIATAIFPLGVSWCLRQEFSLVLSILLSILAMLVVQYLLLRFLGHTT